MISKTLAVSLMLALLLLMAAAPMAQTVPMTIQAGGFFQTGQTTTFAKGVSFGVDDVIGPVGMKAIGLTTDRHDEEFSFFKAFAEYPFNLYAGWYASLGGGTWWRVKTETQGDEMFSAYALSTGYSWDMVSTRFSAEIRAELADVTGPGDMYFVGLSVSGYVK